MDIIEAYEKLKGKEGRNYLIEAVDFGEFFGFLFSEEKVNDDYVVSAYDCVNKSDGSVFVFNPITNLKLLTTAEQYPLNMFD